MKILFSAFLVMNLIAKTLAQPWTVGIPLNETIIDYPDNILTTAYCDSINFPNGQEAEFRIQLPPVDGINYFVVIDFAANPLHTYKLRQGANVQIMSLGDSMQLFSTAAIDTIHLSYAGYESSLSLKFQAAGTPATAGQLYPCGSTNDGWYNQPIGCLFPNFPDPLTYLTDCVVEGPNGSNELRIPGQAEVFPNPAFNFINVYLPGRFLSEKGSIRIFNTFGNRLLEISILDDMTSISLEKIPWGIYFYEIQFGSQRFQTGKIIIE